MPSLLNKIRNIVKIQLGERREVNESKKFADKQAQKEARELYLSAYSAKKKEIESTNAVSRGERDAQGRGGARRVVGVTGSSVGDVFKKISASADAVNNFDFGGFGGGGGDMANIPNFMDLGSPKQAHRSTSGRAVNASRRKRKKRSKRGSSGGGIPNFMGF